MDFLMGILSTIFKVDEQINNKNRNGIAIDKHITVIEDVEYTDKQKLDIYYNAESHGKRPILINVHGGGWMVGDKKWRKGMATIYAEHDFFVINPNYALSPADYYPECVRDIFRVIDWVSENASKYSLDLDRLYITGDSAGAHIAAMVCAVQSNRREQKKLGIDKPKIKIAKAALFCGVYNFDKCVDQKGASGLVGEMTGVDYKKYVLDFPFYRELSPLNFVDKRYPPTYMVSAPFDIFCAGQAELLEERLREYGIPYKHYIPEDKLATHCFHLNLNRDDSMEAIEGAIDFLNDTNTVKKRVQIKRINTQK